MLKRNGDADFGKTRPAKKSSLNRPITALQTEKDKRRESSSNRSIKITSDQVVNIWKTWLASTNTVSSARTEGGPELVEQVYSPVGGR